jgi:RNA polymerase sigma-70 factor (ECF subfamily)
MSDSQFVTNWAISSSNPIRDKMIENQAIAQCKDGDVAGLKILYELHAKKIFYLALRILSSPQEAEDVVQDIFIKVFKNIKNYRGEAAFGTWLYRVTSNHCLDILRKRKKHTWVEIDETLENSNRINFKNDPEHAEKMLSPTIVRALDQLSPRQRICLVMREMENLSYEEISICLGISLGSVKSNIYRAKEYLRNYFKKMGFVGEY